MNSANEQTEDPAAYWNNRWATGETGWDVGSASPPIATFMEQYGNREAAILIPGCGNAYEAAFLVAQGFTNITVLDIAPQAAAHLQEKFAGMPAVQVVCGDFFEHQGTYDLMLEQTFFCALPPEMRNDYVLKAASLLRERGRIVGVLFQTTFEKEGPPFGGHANDYRSAFSPFFHIEKMEACYNSILPRAGSELFVNLLKKELP